MLPEPVSYTHLNSRSMQMMGRRLMTPDELKSMPKGTFITMKTGMHPMKTTFRLFLDCLLYTSRCV